MSSIDGSNQNNDNRGDNKVSKKTAAKKAQEKDLARMEALLSQSAKGFHIIFDHNSIAHIFRENHDDRDFYDFDKMKQVQDAMTALIKKRTYLDKVSYIDSLPQESYRMLVRAYFHIVENTVRASSDLSH